MNLFKKKEEEEKTTKLSIRTYDLEKYRKITDNELVDIFNKSTYDILNQDAAVIFDNILFERCKVVNPDYDFTCYISNVVKCFFTEFDLNGVTNLIKSKQKLKEEIRLLKIEKAFKKKYKLNN